MLAAAFAWVLATPLAAWWLIGDQSEGGIAPRNRDYVAHAPKLPSWLVPTAGALALLTFLICGAALAHAVLHRRVDRRWLGVLAPLALGGVLVAYTGRVATAGVHGANIGFGLCVILGGPILAVLVASAIVLSVAIRKTHAPDHELESQPGAQNARGTDILGR